MSRHVVRAPSFRAIVDALILCTLIVCTCGPAEAQILRRLTDLNPDHFVGWSLDDDGSTAVAVWRGDPPGTNPDHVYQIFKWSLPSGPVTQLTHFAAGSGRTVSISDDGEWIVFDSSADPVQQNDDGTMELFRMRSDGSEIVQLTNDDLLGGGYAECPMISGSGNRVLFYGTYDPVSTNPDHLVQVFVLDLVSMAVTQLSQSDSEVHVPYSKAGRCYPSISDDGERIVFSSSADLTGQTRKGTARRRSAALSVGSIRRRSSPIARGPAACKISSSRASMLRSTGEKGG